MSQTVGLDLQTTYSCVGVFRHGKIEYIGNDQGNRATYNPQSDGMVEKRQQSIFKYFMMSQGPVSELTAVQQDAENLMYTPSHTDTDKPMFPAFAECSKRLESFRNWPEYPSISRKDLAEAGLVYIGVADVTRCYSCGGGHCCWTDNHIPMEEHARLFPKCSHILQVKGTKFVKEICKKKKTEMHVGTVIQQFRVENETPELGYPSRLARKTSEIHKEYDEKYQGYSQRFSGVKEDTKQMSDRHRVSLILQSEAFGRELEATVEEHLQQNNSPERLMALQQITDLLAPNKKPFQGEFETGTQGTKQKPVFGSLYKMLSDADNVHLKTPVPSIASRAIIGEETIAAVQKAGSKSKSNDFHPEKPEVPQYAAYAKRLQSFEKWPESPSIDKKRLEEAGFAYTNSCYLHTDLLRLFREENCNSERKKDKSWFNNKQGWAIKMINSLMNVINGTLKTATEVMSLLVQKCPELFPKLDRTPTQKDLLSFAQAIGENFRYFGLALGIGDVSLDQISMENPTVVMKTFKMLRKWCDENPLESSLSKLIQTLKTCSCVRVDWGQIGKLCL